MSIAIMAEGETMGRGIPPDPRLQSRLRSVPEESEIVAILGAGPAGLLAAHAVALAGRLPVIFSAPNSEGRDLAELYKPMRSKIGAATYLHAPIPDLTTGKPDDQIRFEKIGTAAGYAKKVYGDRLHETSWDRFEGSHPAWALQPVYDELWARYFEQITPINIDAPMVAEFVDSFPLVISTIPPSAYCQEKAHEFPSRPIWVIDRALESVPPQTILYDGRVGAVGDRYRSSRVFGHESTEFAQEVPGAHPGIKVQSTNCDCFPEVVRAGRWGEWKPGVLVHHAFQKVFNGMFDQFEGS